MYDTALEYCWYVTARLQPLERRLVVLNAEQKEIVIVETETRIWADENSFGIYRFYVQTEEEARDLYDEVVRFSPELPVITAPKLSRETT